MVECRWKGGQYRVDVLELHLLLPAVVESKRFVRVAPSTCFSDDTTRYGLSNDQYSLLPIIVHCLWKMAERFIAFTNL